MQYFDVNRLARAFPQLTERELQILDLIAAHRTNAQIAAELGLTPKTIRNHGSNIFTKLQVATREDAIARVRRAHLGDRS